MAARKRQTSPDLFECVSGFACDYDGQQIVVSIGQRVRAGHPILAGREEFFRPLEIHYDIEQATASPGEKRGEA